MHTLTNKGECIIYFMIKAVMELNLCTKQDFISATQKLWDEGVRHGIPR